MHSVFDSLRTHFDRLLNVLHSYFDKIMSSPHHWMVFAAAAAAVAVLLIGIPLARLTFRSRRSDEDDLSFNTPYPSMLGLTSAAVESRRAGWEFMPPPVSHTPPPVSNVTAINEALTVPCIHCGVTISTREDFCPACGYAQPVKQSFIAAFPA
jgi:hypothetical protein